MNEIKLIITTDSSGAVTGVKNLESQVSSSSAAMTGSLKNVAVTLGVAFGAREIVNSIKDFTLLAARVETLGVVLDVVGRNAGKSHEEMQAYVEGVKSMGITTQESLQTVIRMSQAQMDLNKSSDLARVAQDAAVIGNTNSSDALNKLVYGIQSAQVEVLRTIGINVSFEESYKKLARELGTTSEKLTEQQKVQARTNAVKEAGTRIAGTYAAAMGTVGKQLGTLARPIEEASLKLGKMFVPSLQVLVRDFTGEIQNLDGWLRKMKESGDMDRWANNFAENIKDTTTKVKDLVGLASSIPVEFYEAGSMGLIGKFLFGSQVGKIIATLTLVNQLAEKSLGFGIQSMPGKYKKATESFQNIWDAFSGKRDWKTGAWKPGYGPEAIGVDYEPHGFESPGGGAPAGGKGLAGPTAAELKKLADAQREWGEKIELMNPSLDEFDKKVLQIEQDAQKLRDQFGDQVWITEGEEWGKAFIQWADEINAAEKQAEASAQAAAEMERIAAENKQKALDLTLKLASAETQRAEMNLSYDQRKLELNHRYGEITSGQAASSAFDMDVRRLEIARDHLSVEIQKRTEATSYEDMENNILILGLQQQAVQEEINRLLGLRSTILKEHEGTMGEGFTTGWNKYFDDMGSQFQRGEGFARDSAQAMHGALEDFFFDPTANSWDNMWKGMQRVAAKAMSDIAMDAIRQLARAGLGAWFGGGSRLGDYSQWYWGGSGGDYSATPAHGGGIMGTDGVPTRRVPSVLFSIAPRLHGGLMPDEYPAVLKRGEGVFTQAQMAALGGSRVIQPVVNIYNSTDSEVSTQARDNNGTVELDVMIDKIMAKNANQTGSAFGKSMQQTYTTSKRLTGR